MDQIISASQFLAHPINPSFLEAPIMDRISMSVHDGGDHLWGTVRVESRNS